mmetsp:Transcript_10617/g.17718  ORF Transcript_10617/g.17718 Transcript_10617/m.17718 type:complete len:199 (+) Transcript_10617:76-672(+)
MPTPPTYSEEIKTNLKNWAEDSDKKPSSQLQTLITDIANFGEICYPWDHIKKLLTWKLKKIITKITETKPVTEVIDGITFEQRLVKLYTKLNDLPGPPFTVQRLCELLVAPSLYAEPRKYVFAVEKMVFVSTVNPVLSEKEYNSIVKTRDEQMAEEIARSKAAAKETADAMAANRSANAAMEEDDNNDTSNGVTKMDE